MDSQARWNERFGLPPVQDPTAMPYISAVPRIRREQGARDTINSRAWDFFHATPPTQLSSGDLLKKNAPVYNDMNPLPSRINTVQYRIQPDYMPDPPRGATTAADLGIPPPPAGIQTPSNTFSQNPYTQRLDAGGSDSRNMIRELRGAVVEDNRERAIDSDRRLTERQFYDRWLPAKVATDAASLQAYELLRPKLDELR